MPHLATLGVPPPRDAQDPVQRGRFLRAFLGRALAVSVVMWALVLLVVGTSTALLAIGAISVGLLAADVVWLSYRLRRDERR